MRIRVIHKPPTASIDGLQLDRFQPGYLYDVGTTLGMLMLAEGWAEPVINEEPALLVPLSETKPVTNADAHAPPNLIREKYPPYFDALPAAADLERRKHPRTR